MTEEDLCKRCGKCCAYMIDKKRNSEKIRHSFNGAGVPVTREAYFTIIRENLEMMRMAGDQSLFEYDELVELLIEICDFELGTSQIQEKDELITIDDMEADFCKSERLLVCDNRNKKCSKDKSLLHGNLNSDFVNDKPRMNYQISMQGISFAKVGTMLNLNMKKEELILTVSQAAELLGVSERSIYRYKNQGLLPYYQPKKRLYFMYSDVLECLGTRKQKGGVHE